MKSKKFDEINIIPFIDIMLVLLAIVLVTASFISQGKIKVNVPQASTSQALKAEDLAKLITINAENQLFFNDKAIDSAALEKEISAWNSSQRVTLKVDGKVPFETFVQLTDMLAKYQITNVSIVTQKDNAQ